MRPPDRWTVVEVAGLALIALGVGLIALPAGLIAAGCGLLALALAAQLGGGDAA